MQAIIIIGSGASAHNLLREIRKLDAEAPITLICADSGDYYYKPNLSTGLTQQKQAEDLIMMDSATIAEKFKVNMITDSVVTSIDTTEQQVFVNDKAYAYSKLVLACGATPIQPKSIPGLEHTISINHWQDYVEFRKRLSQHEKAKITILGAGLIGCEFANDLIAAHDVTVVANDKSVLAKLLPAQFATHTETALTALGVKWHLQTEIKAVNKLDTQYQVQLGSDETITSDLVISALGLRAQTELAQQAGINVQQGIVVDEYLQTSADNVYALGDCAEIFSAVRMYIMPIQQAAKVLAQNLCGDASALKFPVMPITIKTPANPTVVCPPEAGIAGEWQEQAPAPDLKAVFMDASGQAHGFVLMGKAIKERMALQKSLFT